MPRDFLPTEDLALRAWLDNFQKVALANEDALQLSVVDAQNVVLWNDGFSDAMDLVEATRNAAKGAVRSKNEERSGISEGVRSLARRLRALPGVDQGLLQQLGILTNNASAPLTPATGLVVVGCSDGTNTLTWSRAGNSNNVQFLVESRTLPTGPWSLVTIVSKTRFDHNDQTPGQQTFYRVTVLRSGEFSAPSNIAVVYPGGGFDALEVAA